MTPQEAFKKWYPVSLTPTHEEAFAAGWEARESIRRQPAPSPQVTPGPVEIYEAYPRKIGREAALRAICAAIKRVHILGGDEALGAILYLLNRTKAYAAATARWPKEDRQFIPHPATWFNRGSYDDDPKEWERGTGPVMIKTVN